MSEAYDYDLVCIGSGPAGQRAAVQAAKLGKRVAVIEKQRSVGGVCIETGTIPSQDLPRGGARLLRAAAASSDSRWPGRSAAHHGAARASAWTSVVAREVGGGRATSSSATTSTHPRGTPRSSIRTRSSVGSEAGTRPITAANVLIAVGHRAARAAPASSADGEIILTPTTSMRAASSCRARWSWSAPASSASSTRRCSPRSASQVTVVDKRAAAARVPRPARSSTSSSTRCASSNVTFRCGEAVERIEMSDGAAPARRHPPRVGQAPRRRRGAVLGRPHRRHRRPRPRRGRPRGRRARAARGRRRRSAPRVPHIFAAGDVIGFPALAATSSEQGRLAACHMFGARRRADGRRTSRSASTRSRRSRWSARPRRS